MAYRNYSPSNGFIVSKDFTGDFTKIQDAINVATAGKTIFIKDGQYDEDPALKAGVNIVAWTGDDNESNVIINGKCTFSSAGTVNISNIRLQTNSDYFLEVTGSAASIVNIEGCYLSALNNTGISLTSSSSSSAINIYDCEGDIGITGIGMFTCSSAGGIHFFYCDITNHGLSTTASTVASTGSLSIWYSNFNFAISYSSSNTITSIFKTIIDTGLINTTPITTSGTGQIFGIYLYLNGGTASAASIGAGTTLNLFYSIVASSNANAITGAGTLGIGNIIFSGSSSTVNVTTQNTIAQMGISFDASNVLSAYAVGSWTPTIDGAVSGTTTYVTQSGSYIKIGKSVTVNFTVTFTAATGTGNVVLGGLPFTISAAANYQPIGNVYTSGVTWPASHTQIALFGNNNDITSSPKAIGSAQSDANIQMANSSQSWYGTMTYISKT